MDNCNQLLHHCLSTELAHNSDTPSLLIADESLDLQILHSLPANDKLHLLCNRFDNHLAAEQRGFCSHFTDLETPKNQAYNQLFFRVSKERLVCYRVLNMAMELLATGKQLFLIGRKDDGIKTYADKAKKVLGFHTEIKKHGDVYLVTLSKQQNQSDKRLDDGPYAQTRLIRELEFNHKTYLLSAKPGVYGWKKIDAGSEFLIDNLDINDIQNISKNKGSALDLGCGSGYLSLALHAFGFEKVVATDNSAAAIDSSKMNFANNNCPFECLPSDAGQQVTQQFDLIICNPPFHKGKDHSVNLTTHFADAIAKHLKPLGQAWLVCNAFVGMEKELLRHGLTVKQIKNNGSFKVLRAAR